MSDDFHIVGSATAAALSNGQAGSSLFDRQSAMLMSNMNGRYMEMTRQGRIFMACNITVATLSTLSTTCTGFCLTNPVGSGKVIALLSVNCALGLGPAGASAVALAYGPRSATAVTQTTPLIVRSGLLEGFTGVGLTASAATLPVAPVAIRGLAGVQGSTSIATTVINDDVGGAVMIQPGSSLSLSYLTTAITCQTSMFWAELPE